MIKISVIIPVYNTEDYIEQCLDSVIKQTYKNLEIICIDDCSKDNSYNILKKYQQIDNRIIILQNSQNIGPGLTKNIGIKNASGDFIHFLDSDDFIDVNTYEELINKIKTNNDLELIQFGYKTFSNKDKKVIEYYNSLNYKNSNFTYLEYNNFYISTGYCSDKLIKLKLLKDNNILFSNYPCYEDNIVSRLSIITAKNIFFSEKHYYTYRIQKENGITAKYYVYLKYFFEYFIELTKRTAILDANYQEYILILEYQRIFNITYTAYKKREISYKKLKELVKIIDLSLFQKKNLKQDEFFRSKDILKHCEFVFIIKSSIKDFLKSHLPVLFRILIKLCSMRERPLH